MRIKVLGPVEVERDGELVAIGGPQQRRLLALLVAHRGQVVSTDRLVEALWPDDGAPDGAVASMRTYIARLRSVLPDGWITTQGSSYGLSPNGAALDLAEFDSLLDDAAQAPPDVAVERCEMALRLWRGPPFGEFTDEWWALPESSRLVERRASAEEQRAAALMAIGHHNRAIPDLEHLVRVQPLRERPVRLLMVALDTTGRRAEALRACRSFRDRLADETGLDPSRELDELEAALLAGEAAPQALADLPLRGYTIHRVIGEGAHGRLYEATQPGTDRPVAIKVIRPDLADSTEYVRRFEAEARLVARLEHPHIVPLYDYWREPGGAYLVFRLLTGGTARDSVISGGPWSLERTAMLVEEISGALIAAHGLGVTHNDVKATNVLLDGDGAAYLTDFGIALVGGDGESTDDSQRRDVRDLAWMVWEMLTGERRPEAPSRARNGRSPNGSVPSLIGRAATVPDGLDAVLSRGGSVEGGFASVAEFLLAWRAATGRAVGCRSTSAERLATDSARRLAARQLTLATSAGINPYRGLRPFEEADAVAFHGRDEVVGQLLAAVGVRRFVAVVGASGSGKSSVVRAGLAPALVESGAVVVTMTPGDDPLSALREALREVATASDGDESGVPVGALGDIARRLGRMVVVVDQFEECWTRATPGRRHAFLEVVTSAIADESTEIQFVVTVRADLLDQPLEEPSLGPHISAGAYVLSPLTATELADAIVLPAAQVGVAIDEGVVADLIAETVIHHGSLPLLQFTLTELYDKRVDGVIGPGALAAIGGLAGAIGRRAEELYRSLDDAAAVDARDLFARLVTPGYDAPDTRRRAPFGELSPGMLGVATRYVEARLLVTDRDPSTREPTVEVAHEALLTRWSRLKGWIEEDRRWLAQLQHLSSAARAWDAGDRRDADVYRGVRLEAAIEAIDVEGRAVSAVERSYVDAGRASRDAELVAVRRTTRRLRGRLTAVAAALVVALVAGALAFVQRQAASEAADEASSAERAAQIEALVGRAESMRGTQRDTAALLAIEAHRMADTARTRSSLFGTFTDEERFLDAHRFPGDRGTSGIVMPDGESAYLTDQAGQLRPYDLDTGDLGEALPAVGADDRFPVLAASRDGHRIAMASRSDPATGPTRVGVIDLATGSLAFDPLPVDGPVTSAVFLPDGRLALVTGEDGRLVVVDTGTGAEVTTIPGVEIPEDPIIWSLDPRTGASGRVLRRPSSVALAGDELLLGAADGSLRTLDAATLDLRRTLKVAPQTLSGLRVLGDGTAVTSGRLGMARIDVTTGRSLWSVPDENQRCANLLVIEQRGVVYCGDPYGRLEERDLTTGIVLRRLDAQNGNSGSLWAAAGGTELVSFGNNEPVVSRWRLDHSGPITRVVAPGWRPSDFNHTAERLLLESGDPLTSSYRTGLLDTAAGTMTTTSDNNPLRVPSWTGADTLFGISWEGASVEFTRAELSSDGQVGRRAADGVVVQHVALLADFRIDTGKDQMLIRYRDDEDNSLTRIDPRSLEYGPTIPVDGLVTQAISRTGDRIVAGTTTGVVVFDGQTGEQIGALTDTGLRGAVITVTDQLFVGSLGGELTQYDLATLEPIRTYGGSRGLPTGGAGTADGSLVAIVGLDREVSLFDVATGLRIGAPIAIPELALNQVNLSLDGRWLAVGGQPGPGQPGPDEGDQPTQLWDLDPTHWESAACAVAGRNLTREEWATHIGDLSPYRPTCSQFPSDS